MAKLTGSNATTEPRWPSPDTLRVRRCVARDRRSLEAIGVPEIVSAALCPSLLTRLAWGVTGLRAESFLAEMPAGGPPAGCVQFVRARRDTGTWMFGHWRVAAGLRRQGIGRRLIEEGMHRLSRLRRLYSYVDWGNEISILAHERLGFERASEHQGAASLGALATMGPVTPAPRLQTAGPHDGTEMRRLYRAAMGSLWSRLFPGAGDSFSPFAGAAPLGPTASFLRAVRQGPARIVRVPGEMRGADAGFLVLRWRGSIELYTDPGACDARLLARVAAQLLALGTPRDTEILLRGLPQSLLVTPGPITARVLMGRVSGAPPPCPPAGSSARRRSSAEAVPEPPRNATASSGTNPARR